MTSQTTYFRIFESGSHNLKELHEIPLNMQYQSIVSRHVNRGRGGRQVWKIQLQLENLTVDLEFVNLIF